MKSVVSDSFFESAIRLKSLLATYREAEDLINLGAYKSGSNAMIDQAIHIYPELISFLKQDMKAQVTLEETYQQISQMAQFY